MLDARTGREQRRVKPPGVYYQNPAARYELRDMLAFAPDGKTVAWSRVESTADVFLIEVRSGQVRRRLPGDSYPVRRLAFSPDGSKLLSAGPDGSALVWDLSGRAATPPAGGPVAPETAAGWWDRLGGRDAGDAAMREMAARPAAAIALLRERLKPVKPVDAARLDALVSRLGAPGFADREAAVRELVALGEVALPRLREAAGSGDPEVARRARAAIERIEFTVRVREERAVEVLGWVGGPDATALLRDLARGMPDAALTADAAAALARLARLHQ